MEKVTVEAEVRSQTGKHALHELRRAGKVPAVLYGGTGQSVNLQLQPRQLANVLGTKSKHHTLFQLRVQGGEETLAMIVETQWEPVRGTLRHVDFKRVLMDRKIRVQVPIITVGEAKGIKEQGGVFELMLRELEVECLPADLLDEFTLDVSNLMLNESIRVSDLQTRIGDRIRILREPQAVICHVITPKAIEEEKPVEAVAAEAPAEPEVIKKGKIVEAGEEAAEAPAKKEKEK
ncbi:MAG: 50S ribosomal protein L25 [Acidobacteria bacterium]|nr:50S ribosomal protein L25 [Acidobacteriota bacterium]